jgi:hypothetical protein
MPLVWKEYLTSNTGILKCKFDNFSRGINTLYLKSGDYDAPNYGKGMFGFRLSKAE